MKTKLLYFIIAMPIMLFSIKTTAQTVLSPGDIAIFHNQADEPDDFAFVTFVDIDAGTGIFFTDCGTSTTGFRSPACTEGAFKYTVPSGGLASGDIVRLTTSTDFAVYNDSRITGTSGPSLATSGDQVVVFQDAGNAAGGTDAANNPTFLFINHNSSTMFNGDPADSNESSLPSGLNDTTPPRSALGLGAGAGVDVEWDNTVYTGTYDFSGFTNTADAIAAAKLAMTDPANYTARTNDITETAYANAVAAIPAQLNLNTTLSNDEFLSNAFAVYPNPSNGNITIRNAGIAMDKVQVSDLNGRVIFNKDLNGTTDNEELNLGSVLSSGIYLMTIKSKEASTVKKIVIK